jgi:hypothetical protein
VTNVGLETRCSDAPNARRQGNRRKSIRSISGPPALGTLVESIGKRLPIVATPYTNTAHEAHPAFKENIEKLRAWGVTVLYGPDVYPVSEPGTGGNLEGYPWGWLVEAVKEK